MLVTSCTGAGSAAALAVLLVLGSCTSGAANAAKKMHTLAAIPTVEIAAGVQMPVVSLGTGGSSESLNVTDYTRLWLEAGGRGIDCAAGYYDAARIQVAIAASGVPRHELFLTSKCPGGGYNATHACALQVCTFTSAVDAHCLRSHLNESMC